MLADGGKFTAPNDDKDFTRLHITPLDPDLLKVYVPASSLPTARNISYHTIETFPEKRYGFVELPKIDADKLRAKLNGAVLKGTKVAIEKARPLPAMGSQDKEEKKLRKREKREKAKEEKSDESRKRKREDNVVGGVALSDRNVKRGWTETPGESAKRKKKERSDKGSKDKDKKDKDKKEKKRTKSKYTDQEECLLKTKLPPTAASNTTDDAASHKKKKKKGNAREVTIHEFEKTTKFPSFLKDSSSSSSHPAATEYVEGKGWVDEDGNVVEAVTIKKPAPGKKAAKSKKAPKVVVEDDEETSSSGSSSDEEEPTKESTATKPTTASKDDDDTSSEGSGDSEDEGDAQPHKSVELATPFSEVKARLSQPTSSPTTRSPTTRNLSIKIPPTSTPKDKLHPLEALYKRKPPGEGVTETPAQKAEPFSFFGGGGDDEEDNEEGRDRPAPMPMTPFTRQDFESRTIRSAAPTPDTAHPAKMQPFVWPTDDDNDEEMSDLTNQEEEEQEEQEEQDPSTADQDKSASDFQSWFWENRGDLNRSWMKRRKTAAKEKRHRENKSRASRAV